MTDDVALLLVLFGIKPVSGPQHLNSLICQNLKAYNVITVVI